ncbi:MAG TPA: squalene synthase HpnC [Burkholderiaceae bacterium]|nr:squalene synthase HpnC [Burkholderiaceae bacterium]
MGVGHYENFPVASLLLPARLRPAVRAIYRFARTADDVADEGDASPHDRLAELQALGRELDGLDMPRTRWPDLAAAVSEHRLPLSLFHDLLSAFAQDVTTRRYDDYAVLLDYCRRSANPVGRLLLALYGRAEPGLLAWSDAICTGLQLTNFWQDVAIDWDKGRVYLPQEDLARFGVDEAQIATRQVDDRWRALMAFEVARARALLQSGAPLAPALDRRIGLELRLVVQGGLRILERIDAASGDVFRRRPVLSARDWTLMGLRALRPQPDAA